MLLNSNLTQINQSLVVINSNLNKFIIKPQEVASGSNLKLYNVTFKYNNDPEKLSMPRFEILYGFDSGDIACFWWDDINIGYDWFVHSENKWHEIMKK